MPTRTTSVSSSPRVVTAEELAPDGTELLRIVVPVMAAPAQKAEHNHKHAAVAADKLKLYECLTCYTQRVDTRLPPHNANGDCINPYTKTKMFGHSWIQKTY